MDALFGYGVVGKATAAVFKIPRESCYDQGEVSKALRDMSRKSDGKGWLWICVPTPEFNPPAEIPNDIPDGDPSARRIGSCDTSIVEQIIVDFKQLKMPFVIRSTVIPGTAKRLIEQHGVDIVSFPEFLSERTAEKDAKRPWMVVVGGRLAGKFIHDYPNFFSWAAKHMFFDNASAEMVKYSVNCLFATLTIFGNQMYDACQKVGITDWDGIEYALARIPWFGMHHLSVMKDGYRGYSGRCLPKDIRAFIAEYDSPLLKEVDRINEELLRQRETLS
jgi:UDP-glucose 6-dehydrogenase